MQKECPKCGGEIVEVNLYHPTRLISEGLLGWHIADSARSTKYVCSRCGYVVEERMSAEDIDKYRKAQKGEIPEHLARTL